MSRLTAFVLSAFIVTCFGVSVAKAEEPPTKAWMKYLEGQWTYEISDGTKGTAVWTFEADGQSMIGKFKEGAVTAVEIGGWQPDPKITMVNGYDSKGNYWQLEYDSLSAEGGRGAIRGRNDDGEYTGKFAATVVNHDRWGWTINGKMSSGKELDLSATFKRVIPKPLPTKADRLKAFDYFIGKWKSKQSNGTDEVWVFKWGPNSNSIENRSVTKNADGAVVDGMSGIIVWDSGNRRIVNACVSAAGNRLDFPWQKKSEKTWQTWRRGGNWRGDVTIIDKNTWTMTWGNGSLTYERQD
jgi:hypothetical protein